jgi:uncharacterized membrane protein
MKSEKSLFIVCLILIVAFSFLSYRMLLTSYVGQDWTNILFWPSLVIVLLCYIANLILGFRFFKNFPKSSSKLLLTAIFVLNLALPVGLYLPYNLKINSAV